MLQLPFNEYMKFFPDNDRGLWGVVEAILGKQIIIEEFERKYNRAQRLVR